MPSRPLRIAIISEHASPLATIGSVDAGGQNTYVLNVATCLARAGHRVDALTRRDDAALPTVVDVRPGMRVVHLGAGPATFVPKEQLLRHMPAFAEAARELVQNSAPYDVVHANFFMSGLVGLRLTDRSARVQTVHAETNPRFHALLKAFGERTGVPGLVNTSFNVRGEPIVGTPRNAIEAFCSTPLDALVIGSFIVEKTA